MRALRFAPERRFTTTLEFIPVGNTDMNRSRHRRASTSRLKSFQGHLRKSAEITLPEIWQGHLSGNPLRSYSSSRQMLDQPEFIDRYTRAIDSDFRDEPVFRRCFTSHTQPLNQVVLGPSAFRKESRWSI
jgi:hypothetical protein